MKQRKRFLANVTNRLAEFAEFPGECTGSIPVIEIKGSEEAYVFGCTRILGYSKEKIDFDCLGYIYSLNGSDLSMTEFTASCIRLTGKIVSIDIL